jgi:hypothetical protein
MNDRPINILANETEKVKILIAFWINLAES